jgi:hypothetical protein
MGNDKRARIHEYLSFRAAVKTDAGTVQQPTLTRVRFGLPVIIPQLAGILWETSRNNVGNSEQNEQMKKRPSVRANHV